MAQSTRLELDERSAHALAELLQRHLEGIVGLEDQYHLAEQVWCVHLIGLLMEGRMPRRMRHFRDVVLEIARELLPYELFEQATGCRRLTSPGGSASTSAPTSDGSAASVSRTGGTSDA